MAAGETPSQKPEEQKIQPSKESLEAEIRDQSFLLPKESEYFEMEKEQEFRKKGVTKKVETVIQLPFEPLKTPRGNFYKYRLNNQEVWIQESRIIKKDGQPLQVPDNTSYYQRVEKDVMKVQDAKVESTQEGKVTETKIVEGKSYFKVETVGGETFWVLPSSLYRLERKVVIPTLVSYPNQPFSFTPSTNISLYSEEILTSKKFPQATSMLENGKQVEGIFIGMVRTQYTGSFLKAGDPQKQSFSHTETWYHLQIDGKRYYVMSSDLPPNTIKTREEIDIKHNEKYRGSSKINTPGQIEPRPSSPGENKINTDSLNNLKKEIDKIPEFKGLIQSQEFQSGWAEVIATYKQQGRSQLLNITVEYEKDEGKTADPNAKILRVIFNFAERKMYINDLEISTTTENFTALTEYLKIKFIQDIH